MMGGKRIRVSKSDDSCQSRAVPSPVSPRAARATSPDHRSNWLCIAYSFPPIQRSGTHRTLGFVKHLDALGFDATVLTVIPNGESIDRTLLDRVPVTTRVCRTPWWDIIPGIKRACCPTFLRRLRSSTGKRTSSAATARTQESLETSGVSQIEPLRRSVKDWLTRLLITPDSRVGWLMTGVTRGLHEIKRRRPRVLYSTSPCITAHLIALVLSKLTRVPWVADFRDPWRDNPFRDLKYTSLELIDAWLERAVLRAANHVVCTTPTFRDLLVQRMPEIGPKCSTILNGWDEADFDGVVAKRTHPADHTVLTHCGDFYGPRRPDTFFAAIGTVLEAEPHLRGKLHVLLVGGEYHDGRSLQTIAETAGVAECIEVLGRREHQEAIALMKGSDALLLAGQSGPGGSLQVPNKLYEYIALKRPIIAAIHPDNPAVEVLQEAHAEAIVTNPDDEVALADAIGRIAAGEPFDVQQPWSGVQRFKRVHRAEQLADLFRHLSRAPEPQASACAINRIPSKPDPVDPLPVSVIVPVSRDMLGLSRTLAALARQTRPPGEVIVAPQDNTRETISTLSERIALYPFARLVIGKRCNVADARNRAIRVAKHDLIACTETGSIPEKTWLGRIIAPLSNHRTEVVGGMCEARGQGALERLIGLMTASNGDRPRDPLRFNPSAKSLAFRASTWKRAGGFANWLDGDDDTLFALRLRSMDPPVGFAIAVDAVASYRPPKAPKTMYRPLFAKACGEAQTGRGSKARRSETVRHLGILLMVLAAVLCGVYVGATLATVCGVAAWTALAWPHHRRAGRAARRLRSAWFYLPAVAVGEWASLARLLGRWTGHRDRRRQPEVFADRLGDHLDSESADLTFHPWSLAAAPVPRTLVVSWNWPPTDEAGANTLADLLAAGPASGFQVLTRQTRETSQAFQSISSVATNYVDWPLSHDRGRGLGRRIAEWYTVRAMIRRADLIAERHPPDRVMCVATSPVALLTAWLIARRLDVPFVPMLFGSASNSAMAHTGSVGLIQRTIERIAIHSAWMVIADSRGLADRLRRNGVERVWALPSEAEGAGGLQRLTKLLRCLVTGSGSFAMDDPPAGEARSDPPVPPHLSPPTKSTSLPEHV